MRTEEELSFAYKYPFSAEAKSIVGSQKYTSAQIMDKYVDMAKTRLEEAFSKGRLEYKNIAYGKLDYVIGYAYARMLVSASGNRAGIVKYAAAEASRSKAAVENSDSMDVLLLSEELGLGAKSDGSTFNIRFDLFLGYMCSTPGFSLSNFRLHDGHVMLDGHEMASLLESAMFKEILKGLPIKHSDLPQRITAAARSVAQPMITIRSVSAGSRAWIEKLIETPIPDVRHRVVNLVLAPYLINVKGMSEDDAFKVISAYIEKCRELDPNTRINDPYIRYQCAYAKRKGLKPLSLVRAKELLGSYINFDLPKEKVIER